jgi:hypothetical protein
MNARNSLLCASLFLLAPLGALPAAASIEPVAAPVGVTAPASDLVGARLAANDSSDAHSTGDKSPGDKAHGEKGSGDRGSHGKGHSGHGSRG